MFLANFFRRTNLKLKKVKPTICSKFFLVSENIYFIWGCGVILGLDTKKLKKRLNFQLFSKIPVQQKILFQKDFRL